MKIVADDKIPFLKGVFEPFAHVQYLSGDSIASEDVADADALIIRTRTICNQELLHGSKIKFIATATIGFDHIDANYCLANGIQWTNAAGCNAGSVMQYVASALSALHQKHKFNFEDRTLGVVGVGNVGKKIVKLAEIFGMRVVLCDPPVARKNGPCGFVSLDGLLREADIITLHVPLNIAGDDKTYHLFDSNVFQKCNKGSFLINSSRGEVVVADHLKNALETGKLAGAVVDVWENEPAIDLELLEMADIATSHIAGYSADGKANGTAMAVQAIGRYFNLPLINWQPSEIPAPRSPHIALNCTGFTNNEIICKAIDATYNIGADDKALRSNVAAFEIYRGNYPLRREFGAYTLQLSNCHPQLKENLKRLGFKVERN